MNIDQAYITDLVGNASLDKGNYYLGTVSEVSASMAGIQIENLSILRRRMLQNQDFVPGSVNYMVLISSDIGIFMGRVKRSAIKDSESIHVLMKTGKLDSIYPQSVVQLLAFIPKFTDTFRPVGFNSVAIHDKVYPGLFIEFQKSSAIP